MVDYQTQCETMLLEGQWDQAQQTALAWTRHPATGTDRDPRPHFVLNVIHLLRGEFAEAWNIHPKCLQEPEDIAQVKEWIEGFVARQSEQGYAHLVMGLFLAQSGQSEQSIASYKESIKLVSFRHGTGLVTVTASLNFARNSQIGLHDDAARYVDGDPARVVDGRQ